MFIVNPSKFTMYSISISDGGKTKISLRFDGGDGILKYFKEFGAISCVLRGPPSTAFKVRLLDNSRKEICSDGTILVVNSESLKTDGEGKAVFSCLVNKGCQAYDCMFFILSVSWSSLNKNEVSSVVSCPFVSGSKGPTEAASEKNRFRASFISTTAYNDFKTNDTFTSEIITETNRIPVTQYISENKELRTYYQVYTPGLFDGPPVALYYRAKTRSQSHKNDPAEVTPQDIDSKIRDKVMTQAILFAQFISKSFARKLLSNEEW